MTCVKIRSVEQFEVETRAPVKLSDIPTNEWSSLFELNDIADFQIEFETKQGQQEDLKEEADSEFDAEKWYLPTKHNEFKRYLRVNITTKDDATIFIVFSDPFKPE